VADELLLEIERVAGGGAEVVGEGLREGVVVGGVGAWAEKEVEGDGAGGEWSGWVCLRLW